MKKNALTIIVACLIVAPAFGAGEEGSSGPVNVGGALGAPIVSLYVPPTRSSNPYAATASNLYAFEAKNDDWTLLKTWTGDGVRILDIEGYAKSSKALYVILTGAVERTSDGGETWHRSEPSGYSNVSDSYAGFAVHPGDRKAAVLAVAYSAWYTRTFGETWRKLPLPAGHGPLKAIAFGLSEDARLYLAAADGLYHSEDLGRNWGKITLASQPALLGNSRGFVALLSQSQPPTLTLALAGRPTHILEREIRVDASVGAMALGSGGAALLWVAAGPGLYVFDLKSPAPPPVLLSKTDRLVAHIVAHPRNGQAVYWTEGEHVRLMMDATKGLSGNLSEALFTLAEESHVQGQIATTETMATPDADTILNAVLEAEAPLNRAVAAALEYAHFRPGEVEHWKKQVRRRNILPRLSVEFGSREFPTDRFTTVTNVDRFGVGELDDLRGNDELRDLDKFNVELRWELGDLLFDRAEIEVSEEARRRSVLRNELITQVANLYYERIERLVELRLHHETDLRDSISLRLRIIELTEVLNQLCGQRIFTHPSGAPANWAR